MHTKNKLNAKKDEQTFSSALVVILLLLLPLLGGAAMLIGSAIGLLAYVVLFRERLRSCGWGKIVITVIIAVVLAAAVVLATAAGAAQENDSKARERIGIYDSRAIAVAFAGSPVFERQLRQLTAEYNNAKEAGDHATVARLEAEAKAGQAKAHQQAFSTVPVDDLLSHIAGALAQIRKVAGVTVLVSKWNESELKTHAGAERVDVTMKLVDAFQPNERQRKSAIEIQKHKPIGLEQAEKLSKNHESNALSNAR